MHFSILLTSAVLASGALAAEPTSGIGRRHGWGGWIGWGGASGGATNPFGGLGSGSFGGSGRNPAPASAPAPAATPAPAPAPAPAASAAPAPAPAPAAPAAEDDSESSSSSSVDTSSDDASSSCADYGGETSAGFDGDNIEPYSDCLNKAQIEGIIADSIYLLENPGISDYNATAIRLFTPDVQVVSDSLKVSNGKPIDGTAFFPRRNAIVEAAFTVLLPINDMTTTYYSYNCEDQTMSWRWTASGMGTGKSRIANNMLFDLTNGRISHVYWEFNSINFVKNVGIDCPVPAAS